MYKHFVWMYFHFAEDHHAPYKSNFRGRGDFNFIVLVWMQKGYSDVQSLVNHFNHRRTMERSRILLIDGSH